MQLLKQLFLANLFRKGLVKLRIVHMLTIISPLIVNSVEEIHFNTTWSKCHNQFKEKNAPILYEEKKYLYQR